LLKIHFLIVQIVFQLVEHPTAVEWEKSSWMTSCAGEMKHLCLIAPLAVMVGIIVIIRKMLE